jgi:hypothetical protein
MGTRWTAPTVTMHLQLGTTSTPLMDGFASWDASAADALAVWNSHINSSKFVAVNNSTVTRGSRNGLNNVYFSNTVNGQAWGANVLAVTLTTSSGNRHTETDVLFNSNLAWNSYRGATRSTGFGTIFDFHRVAMHEFGHVLGLDHPDTHGQAVSALMNSRITSLDGLTSDDISGAQSIYGAATPTEPPPATPTTPTTPPPNTVAPTIASAPASQTVSAGASVTFSVTANGTTPLSYQWHKDANVLPGATNPQLTIANVQPVHSGSYIVIVANPAGSVTSTPATLTLNGPPVVITPFAEVAATAGETTTLDVSVAGLPPFTYQWLKDGQEIAGATSPSLTIASPRASEAGNYSVRVSNRAGTTESPIAAVTINSSRLINLSTRAFLPAGSQLTPGFFIRGSSSKSLLIRAVGPTLRRFGVTSALPETRLELLSPGGVVVRAAGPAYQALSDDDVATRVGAFPLDPNARDATTQATLPPQAYTVRISGGDSGMTGVTLAEIYDADAAGSEAQLVNLSTLGFVGPGENVLTAGFVISGNAPKRLLIRAIGPGLAVFGVENPLSDPQLALMPQVGAEPVAFNDNWPDTAALHSAFGNAGAFALQVGSQDAAIVVTLEPGAYTAIVSSVTASITGQALVEIYDLDP